MKLTAAVSSLALSLIAIGGGHCVAPSTAFVVPTFTSVRARAASSLASAPAWSPSSWRDRRAAPGTPVYDDREELEESLTQLRKCSPLVFAGEVRTLHEQLARAAQGRGFVLMGGDCAGLDEFNVNHVRDTFRVVLQMGLVMTFGSSMQVVKIGRMAGQFARAETPPGSDEKATAEEEEDAPTSVESQASSPSTMLRAYSQSSQTLNILRAFSTGGYADIARLQAWNLDFVEQTEEGSRYRKLATKVDESLRFMKAIGVDTSNSVFKQTNFFTAHECLDLSYEEALTREDSISGRHYDCSAHMIWIGDQTRQVDGAHVEFLKGVGNPVGVCITDRCTPEELVRVCDVLNPGNVPGRLALVVRMGSTKVRRNLPGLIRAVQREGKSVVWISEPMSGNTRRLKSPTGGEIVTLDFETIRDELRAFFDVHDEMGSHPGGVHLEMTGEDVMECVGGVREVTEDMLVKRGYGKTSQPRLNGAQSLELAFLIAERMRRRNGLPPIE